jgi:ribonuclease HI
METAVVARGVVHIRTDIGQGSNNDAEWLALLDALRVAARLGERDVVLLGDSLFVIGRAKATGAAADADYRRLAAGFDRIRIRHVGRSQNLTLPKQALHFRP